MWSGMLRSCCCCCCQCPDGLSNSDAGPAAGRGLTIHRVVEVQLPDQLYLVGHLQSQFSPQQRLINCVTLFTFSSAWDTLILISKNAFSANICIPHFFSTLHPRICVSAVVMCMYRWFKVQMNDVSLEKSHHRMIWIFEIEVSSGTYNPSL